MNDVKRKPDISGIATLSGNPLATYYLDGKVQKNKPKPSVIKKSGRK